MGIDMTDLEMVKRCAEKMGYQWNSSRQEAKWYNSQNGMGGKRMRWKKYDPINNNDQCVELIKHFKIRVMPIISDGYFTDKWRAYRAETVNTSMSEFVDGKTLNRAIVECVARLP